jgi:hypothetical protein
VKVIQPDENIAGEGAEIEVGVIAVGDAKSFMLVGVARLSILLQLDKTSANRNI